MLCSFLAALLLVSAAQAADGGRKFVPLGKQAYSSTPSKGIARQNNTNFISLSSVSRRPTTASMMPLHGGENGRTWKLKSLQDTPRIAKSKEVPDEVKLAMATGRMPQRGDTELPATAMDREKIAAALAPVFAEKLADATEESLETDMELPHAVAAGVANKVEEVVRKGLGYVWPVAEDHYTISSPFGPRHHPVTGKQDFHAGIDIPAPQGTPVLAAMDGEVTAVGTHRNLGRYVKITHADGSYSLYGHLQKWTTKSGIQVKAGDEIGRVGSTGRSTGPHLDFSIRRDGKPFNPMTVLAEAREEKKLALAH